MSILFRYVAREILGATLLTLLALTALFSFFDFISELTNAHSDAYTPFVASLFVALNVPGRLYELTPVALLVGGLFAWNRLALASEFTVMRAGSLAAPRLAAWMLVLGLLAGLSAMVFGEYVTPYSERAAQQLKVRATSGVVAQEFQTGLWAKDGRTFINIREMRPDASLVDVRLYEFDQDFRLRALRRAERAQWQEDGWVLQKVTETFIDDAGTRTMSRSDQTWKSSVTPDLLAVLMVAPERMSISALSAYVDHLRENQQDSERYRIALWSKLVYPIAAPIMLLLALAFAYRPPRVGGAGGRLLTGILLGLAFHLVNRLAAQTAQLQAWPAPVASVMPILLFAAAAILALWWLERN
ncbi:MAG TPA: LPS export ABC transporter permease LptG [Thiobacillaceae bacterium]|nr:LPS export ABC transporter permease LptG [Thiobacillaceae bacterium]HNF87805.1 LPS export ABC transporter permease LptG [Thiobacillaceae bacterium]HNH89618.1 LPS export ABC transporter permease LptG [Thiobacillaceae bacterium]HNI07322.1 LPS export ABC transporter permease LptG [Thiobacillaceae bacterium]